MRLNLETFLPPRNTHVFAQNPVCEARSYNRVCRKAHKVSELELQKLRCVPICPMIQIASDGFMVILTKWQGLVF